MGVGDTYRAGTRPGPPAIAGTVALLPGPTRGTGCGVAREETRIPWTR
jgi:hypothetical protein